MAGLPPFSRPRSWAGRSDNPHYGNGPSSPAGTVSGVGAANVLSGEELSHRVQAYREALARNVLLSE